MDDIGTLSGLIENGGPVVMFLLFIAGFRMRWWVWGDHHRDLVANKDEQLEKTEEDRNFWREVGTRSTATTEESVKRLAGHSLVQSVIEEAERLAKSENRRVTVKDIEHVAQRQT